VRAPAIRPPRHWYRSSTLTWLLLPASALFRIIVYARRLAYRLHLLKSESAGIPVIVVGNLVVGGSGKTPLALWIAEYLKDAGWSPAIVLRGYGGDARAPMPVSITTDPARSGDEALLLARRSRCPVWVGADRVQAARALRAANPQVDVLVLDDGLQHYALRRDIEIVVVDARGFGNALMLPAGPLREPVSRLRSVDAVVSHGAKVGGFAMRLEPEDAMRVGNALERRPLSAFAGKRVHAVAGIGDPERFFRQLSASEVDVIPHPFPDHHPLTAQDMAFGEGATVMMTEKDAVKLRGESANRARRDWWVLPVRAELDPAFGPWLTHRLRDGK